MKSVLITDKLDRDSKGPLKYGLDLAKAFKFFPYVVHVDKFADLHSYDHVFAGLNLEIQNQYIEQIKQNNDKKLAEQIKTLDVDFEELKFETLAGDPADEIVEYAKNPDIELVILGDDNRDEVEKIFMGSVIEKIIHKIDKSVLVVKDNEFHRPKDILVPFDFSDHCFSALDTSIEFAKHSQVRIHLVNFISCYYDGFYVTQTLKDGLTEAMTEIIEKAKVELSGKFESLLQEKGISEIADYSLELDHEGSISDSILKFAKKKNNDFIAMGSHKRGKIMRTFLGSVSHNLVRKSDLPVLIAK